MAIQPREELISVGGIKAHTLIGGQGDPLLVLHGAGGSLGWRRWIDRLAENFTVYAPSHPGYDKSDSADWMESVRDLARFYLWFLDVVGLDRVHLIGSSMGGWTAAELAVMNPHVLNRLVLVDPVGLKPEKGEILDIFFHSPEEVFANAYYNVEQAPEYAELYGQPPTAEQRDIQMRNREMAARLTWKPYMFNPRLPHFLPRVTVPTLIVWGRDDAIVPLECGEQYQRLLPNATLRVIDQCGHSPQIEKPDEFLGIVTEFLGVASPAGAKQ